MTQVWWKDVFRGLFGMLDSIIYGLISTAYTLLNEIAHFRVFDDATLEEFSTRIYAILGIIMLFKLSFSFINYMINPDAFTDKEKGVQNIIKNVVVMFIMLVMSPWVFSKLWEIQGAILDDQVIARFVFGTVNAEDTEMKYIDACSDDHLISNDEDRAGEFIAIMVLRGFYQPYNNANITGESSYKDTITALCRSSSTNVSGMLTSDIYNATATVDKAMGMFGGTTYYVMEYNFGISTAVGVVVLLMLVNFCIDVGARMVKLSFLQLMAPVPIISYIDPASGKNGLFKKWLKEVGSTWLSIFIKLLALFFAVAIIQHVGELVPVGETNMKAGVWVQIFVIIGALVFAKQLPGLIQNMTGIKLDGGGFSLNPFKKISNEALFGNQVVGVAAGLGAGALAMGANTLTLPGRLADRNTWTNNRGRVTLASIGKGLITSAGSPFAGATSAAFRTFGRTSKDGKMMAGIRAGYGEAMFAKMMREDLNRRGSTFMGRTAAGVNRALGRLDAAQRQELTALEQDRRIEEQRDALRNRKADIATEEAQLSERKAQVSDRKADIEREKTERAKPYRDYSDTVSKIKDKIDNLPPVKEAESRLEYLKQTIGNDPNKLANAQSQLTSAQSELTAARQQAILNPTDTSAQARVTEAEAKVNAAQLNIDKVKADQAELDAAKAHVDEVKAQCLTEEKGKDGIVARWLEDLEEMRANDATLQDSDYDYIEYERDENGNIKQDDQGRDIVKKFNAKAKFAAGDYAAGIEKEYEEELERIRVQEVRFAEEEQNISDRKRQVTEEERVIDAYKQTDEYVEAHDKQSSAYMDHQAQRVTGPQDRGWMPGGPGPRHPRGPHGPHGGPPPGGHY